MFLCSCSLCVDAVSVASDWTASKSEPRTECVRVYFSVTPSCGNFEFLTVFTDVLRKYNSHRHVKFFLCLQKVNDDLQIHLVRSTEGTEQTLKQSH